MRKPCSAPLAMIVVLAMMLFACTSSQHRAVLDCADSLMNARPDSALTLLSALLPDTNQMRKGDLMRFHLLRTNAENKCDTVLTARHAALMRRVCDYYDHKASPFWGDERGASRMLAHYLLGRCYDDMGEAPAALREFTHATEIADTAENGCVFFLLSNIFYQRARLFLYQMLLPEAIDSYGRAEQSAYQGGDTLLGISCHEHMASAYFMENRHDSVLIVCKYAMKEYRKHGYIRQSYNSYPLIASILTKQGSTELASSFMKEYEQESGLFDKHGEIEKGREDYYSVKGDYLTAIGQYDSARHYYMKLLQTGCNLNSTEAASKGLFKLYEKMNIPDSIAKYARFYCEANDSSYHQTYTEELVKANSMYNYNRLERLAAKKTLQSLRLKNTIYILMAILSIVLVCLALVSLWVTRKRRENERQYVKLNIEYNSLLMEYRISEKQKNEIARQMSGQQALLAETIANYEKQMSYYVSRQETNNDRYLEMLNKYRDSQRQMSFLQSQFEKEIEVKTIQNTELRMRLSQFIAEDSSDSPSWSAEQALMSYEIVREFHQMALHLTIPIERKWKELEELVSMHLTDFYQRITDPQFGLNETEKRMAILIRLQFIVSECYVLLNKTKQNASNIRSSINKKLFGKSGTKGLDNEIGMI